jgi:formamidopyrimidine-DNA glycosylase
MPESGEVRLTVDFLNNVFQGKIITNWIFTGGKYTDNYPEGYLEFDAALPLCVDEVNCKGKFIYFRLSDAFGKKYFILHSLMMTGRWQIDYDDYCKWYVDLQDGKTVWFRDPRTFATVKFTADEKVLHDKLSELGPDIMKPEFKLPLFKSLAKQHKNKNICSFLMDQSIISGCGNYIKAEVLYDAKVAPGRTVGSLTENELELVYQALCVIPRLAYNNKGLSLRDYADEYGNPGDHEKDLKVYGKSWAKRTKTSDGRITYWDPSRQI